MEKIATTPRLNESLVQLAVEMYNELDGSLNGWATSQSYIPLPECQEGQRRYMKMMSQKHHGYDQTV